MARDEAFADLVIDEIQADMSLAAAIPGTTNYFLRMQDSKASGSNTYATTRQCPTAESADFETPGGEVTTEFAFHQHYSNPFPGETIIGFNVKQSERMRL